MPKVFVPVLLFVSLAISCWSLPKYYGGEEHQEAVCRRNDDPSNILNINGIQAPEEECYGPNPSAHQVESVNDEYEELEDRHPNQIYPDAKETESAMQPLLDFMTTYLARLYNRVFFSEADL